MASHEDAFRVGEPVSKVGGDYRFDGHVVAALTKRSGARRYVVEDDRGVLHIYRAEQLRSAVPPPPTAYIESYAPLPPPYPGLGRADEPRSHE